MKSQSIDEMQMTSGLRSMGDARTYLRNLSLLSRCIGVHGFGHRAHRDTEVGAHAADAQRVASAGIAGRPALAMSGGTQGRIAGSPPCVPSLITSVAAALRR